MDFWATCMYARSEAIKEGQTVISLHLRQSIRRRAHLFRRHYMADRLDRLFRCQRQWRGDCGRYAYCACSGSFRSSDTFNANNGMSVVTFNREGFALGLANSVLVTLHAAVPNASTTRCLAISIVGQLTT